LLPACRRRTLRVAAQVSQPLQLQVAHAAVGLLQRLGQRFLGATNDQQLRAGRQAVVGGVDQQLLAAVYDA
jgi:hypothetical protein